MKRLLLTTTIACGLASSAIAGNFDTPSPETAMVAPVAAAITDWSGFYAGGLVSFDSGILGYSNPPGADPYVEWDYNANTSFGGFAGYNFQSGSLVYGVEAAYNSGGIYAAGFDSEASAYVFDLKGRVGFAVGNALIFGVVGYSMTEWTVSDTYSASGLSYGAGLDYLIGEHMFVGAEYLIRDMSGARADNSDQIGHSAVQSAEIRIGWKF